MHMQTKENIMDIVLRDKNLHKSCRPEFRQIKQRYDSSIDKDAI